MTSNNVVPGLGSAQLSRRAVLMGMGAVGVAALAACAPGTLPALNGNGTPVRGGMLRAGLLTGGVAESLDPQKSFSSMEEAISRQLFTTLLRPNADASAAPYLAELMEPNEDGSQWQLKLQKGVTFHDGRPVTVDDVLFTFTRLADPATASGGASYVEPIDFSSTKKISETELLIVLNRPKVDFDQGFYLRETSIIPAGTTDFSRGIGNGPFKLVNFEPGQRTQFERFGDFFENTKPYVDELEFIGIADSAARMNALLGGQVDAVNALDAAQAKTQESNAAISILRSKPAHCLPFCMDVRSKEFADPRVREAMKWAMDRPAILEAAYLGYGDVGNDLFGIGTSLYNSDLPQREYDPEKAKSLLRAAGKSDFEITIFLSPTPAAALAFAQSSTSAGISVSTEQYPPDKYWTDVYMKKPIFESDWTGPWNLFVETTQANGSYPETGFSDPKFNQLLDLANSTTDEAKRKKYYADMQEIVYNDGAYLIPAFVDNLDAVSSRVRGIDSKSTFNRLAGYDFKSAWLAS